MTLTDLTPLLPTDEQQAMRRTALVAELEHQLVAQVPSSRAPRRRLARRLVLPVVAAAGIAGFITAIPQAGAPNIVAEARAAAATGSDIIHVVTRPRIPGDDIVPGESDGRNERWSQSTPFRVRSFSRETEPGGPRGAGSVQSVDDGETIRIRRSWDTNDIVYPLSPSEQQEMADARRSDPYVQALATSSDPMDEVRTLLDRGTLKHDGAATIDGRAVQRLVAHLPRKVTPTAQGPFVDPAVDIEYFVDAKTFVPVRVTNTSILDNGKHESSSTDFLVYERLPSTPENEKLLELTPR